MRFRQTNDARCYATARGYTLVELVLAMSLATTLAVGLTSALLISAEGYRGEHGARNRSVAAQVQSDMLNDLQQATSFKTRTATSVEFKVPDRDGNSAEETIAYAWNSSTKTLTYQYNGSTPATVLSDVTACNFDFLTRSFVGTYSSLPALDPSSWGARFGGEVIFEGFTDAQVSGTTLTIDTPPGTGDGDLLVAMIAVASDMTSSLMASPNWTLLTTQNESSRVTIGVWWKLANAEPATQEISYDTYLNSYGFIMRFTGHDASNPINDWSIKKTKARTTTNPPSPSVKTTVNNALILRMGAFNDKDITAGDPGLPGHIPITMGTSGGNSQQRSGGAGYLVQPTAGDSGESTFALLHEVETVAVTIAIAPGL